MPTSLNNLAPRRMLALAAVLVLAGTTYAVFSITPGVVTSPVTSPGASNFNTIFFINTSPNTGGPMSASGFGDTIVAVEEGRDDRGPFCAIVWRPGPNSPHVGQMHHYHPCYPANLVDPVNGIPLVAPPVGDDGPGSDGPPPGKDCSYVGAGGPVYRFLYRPTNDPVEPGWNALPGGASQIADNMQAVHAVAEAIRQYNRDQAAGNFPGGIPMIQIELDNNSSSPTFREFYKFRVMTHG